MLRNMQFVMEKKVSVKSVFVVKSPLYAKKQHREKLVINTLCYPSDCDTPTRGRPPLLPNPLPRE